MIPRKYYLNDLFDSFLEGGDTNKMKSDIYEKNGAYYIEMDIPGFKKEDIQISCDHGNLTVTAKKSNETEEEDKKYIRRERVYGEYTRSFYLGEVEEGNIEASFTDGILKIALPKKNEEETKKMIEIK